MKVYSAPGLDAGLHHFLVEQLREMLWAEKELAKALPKMAKAANSPGLAHVLEAHRTETQAQLSRLEDIFSAMDQSPRSRKCEAMDGLLAEAENLIDEFVDSPVMDAALISAARKIGYYEIAAYDSLQSCARRIGLPDAADLLARSLDEEKTTADLFSALAEIEAQENTTAPDGAHRS